MARTADHAARRRQIAAAVRRLAAESGLDAVTIGAVAAEAGISVGLVQYYFAAKDDLLAFAYDQVTADITDRVADRIAKGETREEPISAVVLGSLVELLPLDEKRRAEHRIARAFRARALDNPALAQVARATWTRILNQLSTAVDNGKECGEVEANVDAELAATHVAALVDGLAGYLYLEPQRPVGERTWGTAAEQALRGCLDAVFTGKCRQYS